MTFIIFFVQAESFQKHIHSSQTPLFEDNFPELRSEAGESERDPIKPAPGTAAKYVSASPDAQVVTMMSPCVSLSRRLQRL